MRTHVSVYAQRLDAVPGRSVAVVTVIRVVRVIGVDVLYMWMNVAGLLIWCSGGIQ